MSFILFDVGANIGADSIQRTRDDKSIICNENNIYFRRIV
jgi:hypothetical protein